MRFVLRSSLLLIGILFFNCSSDSQKLEEQRAVTSLAKHSDFPKYSRNELIQDLEQYKREMETYHPGLFWYQSSTEWNALFDEVKKSLQDRADLLEFYKRLAFINANISCGHTRIGLNKSFFDGWMDSLKVFPFSVKLIKNSIYVEDTFGYHSELNKGFEILTINGIPSSDIVQMMLPHLAMDGFNVTGKYRYIERRFGLLYPTLIDPLAKEFKIGYRTSLTGTKEALVSGIDYRSYNQSRDNNVELLEFKELPGLYSTYYMKIKTFSSNWLRSEGHNYFQFLASSFQKLKNEGTRHLIIDLRENGGGDDGNGSKLMSYLVDEPFSYYKSIEVLPAYDGWGSPTKDEEGRYFITSHSDIGIHQVDNNHFEGKIFILIDGGSFSATSEFAALIHDRKGAVFIGEETGGGYYGNTSGSRKEVTLANTNISVSIPYWKYLVDIEGTQYYGKGVIPHYKTQITLDDLKNGRDTVLEFAKSLITD